MQAAGARQFGGHRARSIDLPIDAPLGKMQRNVARNIGAPRKQREARKLGVVPKAVATEVPGL